MSWWLAILVAGILQVILGMFAIGSKHFDLRQKRNKERANNLKQIIIAGKEILPVIRPSITANQICAATDFTYKLVDVFCKEASGDHCSYREDIIDYLEKLLNKLSQINNTNTNFDKVANYFVELILDKKIHSNWRAFRERYIIMEYRSQTSGEGRPGYYYKIDINKLNNDIDFVNKTLDLYIEKEMD